VTEAELAAEIDKARSEGYTTLSLHLGDLDSLPASIGDLCALTSLQIILGKKLTTLPESFGNLSNLTELYINCGLAVLPDSFGNLVNLDFLDLSDSRLETLPESFGNLVNLSFLNLSFGHLTSLPESFGNLTNLCGLRLEGNNLTSLPESFGDLPNLGDLSLGGNPSDLSILQRVPNLSHVEWVDERALLDDRYWIKFSDWQPQWLVDEDNAEIRSILIQNVGYEKICQELGANELDNWREYTLLQIDPDAMAEDFDEPMFLLKMICPSTGRIQILRVPPTMTSAEEAICWINHGIHPDEIAVQT
jgi:leucine-rich repeat protein SHOC2